MEFDIFSILKNNTIEVLLIALGAFLLTYLIKLPIKKATAKLDENKRKMVNFVIMLIPMVLSVIGNGLYFGIEKGIWFEFIVFDSAFSSWILSLSLYAIVSRIWLVIKGLWQGKIKIDPSLASDTIKYIKDNIKEISSQIKVDEQSLTSLTEKLEKLIQTKKLIESDDVNINYIKINQINSEIEEAKTTKEKLETDIETKQTLVMEYENKLYLKPSNTNN